MFTDFINIDHKLRKVFIYIFSPENYFTENANENSITMTLK